MKRKDSTKKWPFRFCNVRAVRLFKKLISYRIVGDWPKPFVSAISPGNYLLRGRNSRYRKALRWGIPQKHLSEYEGGMRRKVWISRVRRYERKQHFLYKHYQ